MDEKLKLKIEERKKRKPKIEDNKFRLAYRFELIVKPHQAYLFRKFCGDARFCYNQLLKDIIDNYKIYKEGLEKLKTEGASEDELKSYKKEHSPKVAKFDLSGKKLKALKEQYPFLKECCAQALQQKVNDLSEAFTNFFTQIGKGYPKFKAKGISDSIRFPQHFKLDEHNERVWLAKIGWVRYRKSRNIRGIPKNVTVKTSHGRWYMTVITEFDKEQMPAPDLYTAVGIDRGIVKLATLSDGKKYRPVRILVKPIAEEIIVLQKRLKRTTRGSCKYRYLIKRINRLYGRLRNIRHDYLHWLTSRIVEDHDCVIIEDLNVKNMTKSAAGTKEEPGKNVKGKSRLNRLILEEGFGEFGRMLEYKLAQKGGLLIRVPPKNTSRTCPICGHIAEENRKTQANFKCVKCGLGENADIVGAINILKAGLDQLGVSKPMWPEHLKTFMKNAEEKISKNQQIHPGEAS